MKVIYRNLQSRGCEFCKIPFSVTRCGFLSIQFSFDNFLGFGEIFGNFGKIEVFDNVLQFFGQFWRFFLTVLTILWAVLRFFLAFLTIFLEVLKFFGS